MRPKNFEIGLGSISRGSANRLTEIDRIINVHIVDARSANGGILWFRDCVLTAPFFTMVVLVRKLATRIASKRPL